MVDLVLQLITFFSFAVIVYLMAVAVPRVKDDELTTNEKKLVRVLPLERMDTFLNHLREKVLRRLRIYLLKADRSVAEQLQKSRALYEAERQKKRSLPRFRQSFRKHRKIVPSEPDISTSPGEKKQES